MVFRTLTAVLTVGGSLFIWLWIHMLCKYHYAQGRIAGMRDEALAWCEAFDGIRIPNWQSLPIDYQEDRLPQELANRLYVGVFEAAKEAIGEELTANRLQAHKEEFIRLGLVSN